MGKVYAEIDANLRSFIEAQPLSLKTQSWIEALAPHNPFDAPRVTIDGVAQ